MPSSSEHQWDLGERLLDFAADTIRIAEKLPNTPAGRHVTGQMIRSGTAPSAHHGEAQGAESRNDFIHKMSIGLKELRETDRWLRLINRVPLVSSDHLPTVENLLQESDELIRIFVTSLRTARSK